MYLTCKQADLANALAVTNRSTASSHSTLPILSNVLLDATGHTVKLAATNLETSVTTSFSANVMRAGTVTVPSWLLSDFVKSLPDADITLELNDANQTLNLKCQQFEANIKGLNSLDFPYIAPFADSDVVLNVPFKTLLDAITRASIAVSTDDARPLLTCINMRCAEDRLTLASADGFRLAVDSMNVTTGDSSFAVNVPAKALRLVALTCQLQNVSGEIGVAISEKGTKIGFKLTAEHDTVIWAQLVEGNYPDYHAIIPKQSGVTMRVDADSFAKAVRLANLFGRDAAWVTKMRIADGNLVISSVSGMTGSGTASISAQISGDALTIAFNGAFLRDFAGVTDGALILFEATQASSPGVFKLDGLDEFLYVIMPMHLQKMEDAV